VRTVWRHSISDGRPPRRATCASATARQTRAASASFIGADDWRTIRPGKFATLIIVDGRPDRDIPQTRKVVGVYVAGRLINRESLKLVRQNDPGFQPISPVDF